MAWIAVNENGDFQLGLDVDKPIDGCFTHYDVAWVDSATIDSILSGTLWDAKMAEIRLKEFVEECISATMRILEEREQR